MWQFTLQFGTGDLVLRNTGRGFQSEYFAERYPQKHGALQPEMNAKPNSEGKKNVSKMPAFLIFFL